MVIPTKAKSKRYLEVLPGGTVEQMGWIDELRDTIAGAGGSSTWKCDAHGDIWNIFAAAPAAAPAAAQALHPILRHPSAKLRGGQSSTDATAVDSVSAAEEGSSGSGNMKSTTARGAPDLSFSNSGPFEMQIRLGQLLTSKMTR
ncbi:hypothetical protein NHQ30_010159 [Ciborinia camelliae]|nr:hypothetical protein NHQ30_010159 [Ciborinia camelliae]